MKFTPSASVLSGDPWEDPVSNVSRPTNGVCRPSPRTPDCTESAVRQFSPSTPSTPPSQRRHHSHRTTAGPDRHTTDGDTDHHVPPENRRGHEPTAPYRRPRYLLTLDSSRTIQAPRRQAAGRDVRLVGHSRTRARGSSDSPTPTVVSSCRVGGKPNTRDRRHRSRARTRWDSCRSGHRRIPTRSALSVGYHVER